MFAQDGESSLGEINDACPGLNLIGGFVLWFCVFFVVLLLPNKGCFI